MENADKGLQLLGSEPMIAHVIKRLQPQVNGLIINANRNLEIYRQFGIPVWPDELGGFLGPLAGLQAGLRHCDTPYLVTVPCDVPFFPKDLVERLSHALESQNADLAVALSGVGENCRSQPVFSLLKTSLLPNLSTYLDSGQRKIETWHALLKVTEVVFEDAEAFRNINTLEELHRTNSY
jgi:molybdenum cofactor guanylyltransferase